MAISQKMFVFLTFSLLKRS